jgi:DNA polymerase-3 subunit epsilon
MTTYAILDFEITGGMSPDYGACPTEIAIVLGSVDVLRAV